MALHLTNGMDNEHVTIHEISGFIANDVLGALNEIHAVSKGTKCKQYMYALSLNPPEDVRVPIQVFEKALERIEKKLDLEGQPRVLVFHEKEGRRHAHCVWSRIDVECMKAINISHPKLKLQSIGKSLFLEHGWSLPEGFRDKGKSNPLNYTRAEWEQAKRIGRRPDQIKQEFRECWAISDDRGSFAAALKDHGYHMAKGDRRGFVAVDLYGEVYSISRQLGLKQKDLEPKLGNPDKLSSIAFVKREISGRLQGLFKSFADELNLKHQHEKEPLYKKRELLTEKHALQRVQLKSDQKQRWISEEIQRSQRVRKGFKGLWDKISGRYWKARKLNEQETMKSFRRDRLEKERLIAHQLAERQSLQHEIVEMRDRQDLERKELTREMGHLTQLDQTKSLDMDLGFKGLGKSQGFEPEI